MISKRLKSLQFYFSFFIVCPIVVIVQNISAFFFPFLVVNYSNLTGNEFFKKPSFADYLILLFGIGAIISVIFSFTGPVEDSVSKGLTVLPNYLYWVIVVLFFSSYAKKLDYKTIYKACFWGTLLSIGYYYLLMRYLRGVFVFSGFSPNQFSFILICFGSVSVYYAQERFGKIYAILMALTVVAAGALTGSRSGSLLTFLSCFLTLYSSRLNATRIAGGVVLGILGLVSMQLPVVKNLIFNINERTYELIYNSGEVLKTDQSYLIRVAQVEKGLAMFAERPVTGSGLNTFGDYRHDFKGEFEGFEILARKSHLQLDALSSHNSYINLMAEGGLVLFAPFALLMVGLFIYFISNFKKIHDFQKPFFWALLAVSIHLYFITAIVNVFIWMLIGLAASAVKYNK